MRLGIVVLASLLSVLHADGGTYSWSVDPADLSVPRGVFGDRPSLPGASPLGRPGDPALPAVPVLVALPPGTRADSVTVSATAEYAVPGSWDVRPMQHAVPVSMPWTFTPTPRSSAAYASDLELPVVELTGQGSLLGFPVANLVIRPVSWDPGSGRLTLVTSVTFTVHTSPGVSTAPGARSAASEEAARAVVAASVINPWEVGASGAAILAADELPWGEYLIIAPQSLAAAYEPLAGFKTLLGVPACIVTVEDITDAYPGVDDAQKIRNFLRTAWDQGAPSWVLLGGDSELVPHRNCWATAEGYVDDPAADIYFCDMNDTAVGVDSWDHDGDGVWGEIGQDLMDYHPDYFVGRVPVGTPAQADLFVDKVLAFQVPSIDTNDTDPWYTSMGFTTGILWTSPFCPGSAGKEKIDTLYTPAAWQPVIKLYDDNGTQSYAGTMAMLNAGMQLVNHCGHGSNTMVSIGAGYISTADFLALTNYTAHGRVSIWDTIACLSGAFDQGDCLAEAWVESPGGGGFCMMNTRYGWGEPSDPGNQWSDLVDQQFFAGFFTQDLYNLGVAHAMAWDEFIPLIPSDTHYDWIAKSITLFGDPELPMWSQEPQGVLSIEAPDFLVEGPNDFQVTVSDAGGPVAGARVCLQQGGWEDPDGYAVAFTNASGVASISVTLPAMPAEATITAWARNHAPESVEVDVETLGTGQPGGSAVPDLGRPYPSPASFQAVIPWSSGSGIAAVRVYDLGGRLVRTLGEGMEGSGLLVWGLDDASGRPVPSGVYVVRMAAGGDDLSRRLVVIR